MFQNFENMLRWDWLSLGVTPANSIPEVISQERLPIIFSSPKFFVAFLAGTLMALAFQLLLTNFSVAAGISSWDIDDDDDDERSESLGHKIREVESKIGVWALITSTISIFAASFLAVKLSLIQSALFGAIIGIVIWSTFFFVVVWLGSSTVGSLIGSLANTFTSGLQTLTGAATAGIGGNLAQRQMVSTAEEITAAVRRELTSGFDADTIRNTLQSSLNSLQVPNLNVKDIGNQFQKILKDVDFQDIANSDAIRNINRQTFVDLISSRLNLSSGDINKVADQLEAVWKQAASRTNPTEQVINILKSATPEELKSENLGERLQELVTVGGGNGNGSSNGGLKQAIQYGVGAAVPLVLDRVNLSDIDVNKITNQLQKLKDKVQDIDVDKITTELQKFTDKTSEQISENLPQSNRNNIKTDVEDYISNSFPWHFNRLTIKDEFQDIIYDPQADPETTRRELAEIDSDYLTNLLIRRSDLSEARVKEIVQQLESIRQEVLATVQQGTAKKQWQDVRTQIENYLRSTGKEELTPENIQQNFSELLADAEAGLEDLQERFSQLNRDTFIQVLQQRQDLSDEEVNNIINKLESTRDSVLNNARELQEQAQAKTAELRQRVEDYLRNTNKDELNPEGIKRDFRTLLEDPQAGISALRERLSQFDRDTLVQLLSQRQDLNKEQINQIIDRLEEVRDNILQAPQALAGKAKEQYEQTSAKIAEYLRNTNLEELNPEGIRQDLETLLADPQEGAVALRERLSQFDRDTLVQLLSQQGNLSEEQINRTIDQFQAAINNIVNAPQRLAKRTTQRVVDFGKTLENYLRHTNKEELNPEGIKRDLQLLLQDPRLGIGNLSDRLSKFDRSTIISLLSQREDISEEEANRILDQIESVRDSLSKQYQQIQQRVQSVLDNSTSRIRDYLNSLDRPELNYENIQQDFAKLFDDPQAGFEALRDRLSNFDRDTLVALLSSRSDISQEDANRIIDRVEAARDSVLHRAERIQQETQKRIKAIQHQAKKQVEETKKSVATAAWWLFGTALTSLVASAIAGVIAATGGLNFIS
ncbi:MFS transporter [Calothrix sp. FACHB-1219]|uniref:MFS transporter n=1 Tax=unclassified Calothrix TaxID=2619626 RepID=UPI00168578A0|nr:MULTISPECIES: MFS transporter [unclassified Calothrix]MBD2204089.1 MFS transporter [Calothrix sp. FACHB-168]MBD2221262.1 MFS transporter [Calothrix sp. FACHB-1219]